MIRYIKFTILLILISALNNGIAQWVDEPNYEGKCSHANIHNKNTFFNPDYSWQSPYLFDYDVNCYVLDLEVSDTTTYVSGNVLIYATAINSIDTFAFELIPEQEISVILVNGELQDEYIRDNDNVLVPIPTILPGESIVARIYYAGKPPEASFFGGVTNDNSWTWKKDVTWTLSEPFSAKAWFPVKQDLNDKADSAILNFTTSSSNMVGSQGLLTKVVDLPDNKKRYEWKTNYPIDYYLISFAVTDYMDYSIYAFPEQMEGDSLLIQNFIYNDSANLEIKKEPISKTVDIMEEFCNLFGIYPFSNEKYGHCETQLGGGMEHQTMSTMGNFSFHLIAHELGHMWFGDHVTCATWSDIWINEGFATYSDYLANEFILGDSAATAFIERTHEHAISYPQGSIYIPIDEIYPGNEWRIFSGRLSYDKGASIIHMIRHEIGNDEVFFEVLRVFLEQYAGGTATGEDFKEVTEAVSGMDFETFFDQWYYGEGYPNYDIVYWQDENKKLLISSTQSPAASTPLFEMLLDFKVLYSDGTDTIVSFYQNANHNIFELPSTKKVVAIDLDPDNWTLEKVNSITSVDENKLNSSYFTFGPNPVNNDLNIYFQSDENINRKFAIYDLSGKIIMQAAGSQKNPVFDLSEIQAGVYFLQVEERGEAITNKLIVK